MLAILYSVSKLPPERAWWLSGEESVCRAVDAWVQSLGQEDPLDEEMATHLNILVWKIPWSEEPGVTKGHKESDMNTSMDGLPR